MSTNRKKLIEVALPLDDTNIAAAHEKAIRRGHPSTLHMWWARRPLTAARAVIFAQMVDDPSSIPNLSEEEVFRERARLFDLIRELVKWENTNNEEVLNRARTEIKKSWARTCADTGDDPEKLPAFHDPFAGGGALPLEAQRLGLESYASDLNPAAVLINKAMIEIPPKFSGMSPVNAEARSKKSLIAKQWKGTEGLAEDVRYYGQWMQQEVEKRIGYLYPKMKITDQMVQERPDLKQHKGQKLTVIAWLWARTVKSPNPAFSHVDVPLASSFMLSTKKGKEYYVQPVVEGDNYRFLVMAGVPYNLDAIKSGTKLGRGSFKCLVSGIPISGNHIKAEGCAGRMGTWLMAVVAEGKQNRVYLSPTSEIEMATSCITPEWKPEGEVPARLTGGTCVPYGLRTWADLFTNRQLLALTTFSDLVNEARERIQADAISTCFPDDDLPLRDGGRGVKAYGEAVGVYLGMALSKQADLGNSLCRWEPVAQCPRQLFGRQAIPMI